MSENKEHLRHIMLYYYRKGKNASQTCEKIRAVYGTDAVDDSTCRKWFRKFREGNFDVKDASRAGRPITADVDKIKTMIDNNHNMTTREIGQALNITATTVSRHLRKLVRAIPTYLRKERVASMMGESEVRIGKGSNQLTQLPAYVPENKHVLDASKKKKERNEYTKQ